MDEQREWTLDDILLEHLARAENPQKAWADDREKMFAELREVQDLLDAVAVVDINSSTIDQLQECFGKLHVLQMFAEHRVKENQCYVETVQEACTVLKVAKDCRGKITVVARSLGWSLADIRMLFDFYATFAWQALRAAAEAQTADSSPVAIAAPQDRSAAFTAADSRQPVVAYAKPIDPVPDQFCKDGRPCGPLEGNATELLRAITGRDTHKPAELLKRHCNGRLFVQQLAARKFAVYFQTQKDFNDAGQRLTQSRDSKGKKNP